MSLAKLSIRLSAELAEGFEHFGSACRAATIATQRFRLAVLREHLGLRRFFSGEWYQAVYDLHQATRRQA